MTDNKIFGQKILKSLSVAGTKIAENVVQDIIVKAKKHENHPELWPISVKEEVKGIVGCQIAMDIMLEKLDGYGLIYMDGADYTVVDVADLETDLDEEMLSVDGAIELSKQNVRDKILDVYSFVSSRIRVAALDGDYMIDILANVPPVNSNGRVIKKLIKEIAAKGYYLKIDGKEINVDARPDLTKAKKITVSWDKSG